ncbi:hypothetical protein J3A83DRAFT_4187567 [Scleroderma citrinum]
MHRYHQSLYVEAFHQKKLHHCIHPAKSLLLHSGLMVQKQMLEVVEVSHPNDLAFHLLMGINPPLISQTIRMFLVQLWHGDWVKIFAGSERGTFGCILNHAGENLTLTVSQHGEVIKVAPSTLWVEPLAHWSGELLCEDNTICLGDLFTGPSSICKDFMISNWIPLLIHRGCEVWVITGNKKGCQAYLVLLACQSSIISMLGYPDFQVNNIDVVTSANVSFWMPLNQGGQFLLLPDHHLLQLNNQIDKGFHVCLNVGFGYNHGSLCKQVVYTTCPNQFLSEDGETLAGFLSVTVTAHHDSTKIEHHTNPAVHLTAAPPKAKSQTCMVLKSKWQVKYVIEAYA